MGRQTSLEEGLQRMAGWVKVIGSRKSKEFRISRLREVSPILGFTVDGKEIAETFSIPLAISSNELVGQPIFIAMTSVISCFANSNQQ